MLFRTADNNDHINSGNITIIELEGLNHLFQRATSGAVSEYASIKTTIDPVSQVNGQKRASEIIKSRRNLTKIILFWTPRLEDPAWLRGVGTQPFEGCKYSNCEYTVDKNRLDEADMLLFYCHELIRFADRQCSRQLYVHVTKEPLAKLKINEAKLKIPKAD